MADKHDHHDDVPAVAEQVVPENSKEDTLLIVLASFCLFALMFFMIPWMGIEQPVGTAPGHGGDHTHPPGDHSHSH